jgi:hypothetical protein
LTSSLTGPSITKTASGTCLHCALFVEHAHQLLYQGGEFLRISFFLYAAAEIADSLNHDSQSFYLLMFFVTVSDLHASMTDLVDADRIGRFTRW